MRAVFGPVTPWPVISWPVTLLIQHFRAAERSHVKVALACCGGAPAAAELPGDAPLCPPEQIAATGAGYFSISPSSGSIRSSSWLGTCRSSVPVLLLRVPLPAASLAVIAPFLFLAPALALGQDGAERQGGSSLQQRSIWGHGPGRGLARSGVGSGLGTGSDSGTRAWNRSGSVPATKDWGTFCGVSGWSSSGRFSVPGVTFG